MTAGQHNICFGKGEALSQGTIDVVIPLGTVGLTGYVHIIREGGKPVVLLLNVLMFLLTKEEARYRQPTDVQKLTASYAAVLIGRCTGAETVVCRCSNRNHYLPYCPSKYTLFILPLRYRQNRS
jgi:hypothetical protein